LLVFITFIESCHATALEVNEYSISKPQLLEHLSFLSSDELAGRKIASEGNIKAQEYIIDQLKHFSISPLNKEYQHKFIIKKFLNNISGSNVVAMIPGISQEKSYILLSAHLDHIGVKRNKVFNGADDNASGTSALLSIAQQLIKLPLKHNVIFLFTDGEEVNLTGAKAFVEDHPNIINDIKLNINLDMLAGSNQTKKLRYIWRGINDLMNESDVKRLQKLQNSLGISLKKGFKARTFGGNRNRKWIMSSDHGVFHRAGIPFIYFGVGTHINYHQDTDTFDNANHDFFHLATNSIFQQLIFIDQNI
jgi:Zn-dependent M28 family amino/carboxypeptidase